MILLSNVLSSLASDYEEELLYEILTNARLREAPSLSAKELTIIPGGFVVSVMDSSTGDGEWYRVQNDFHEYSDGYIHKALIKPYDFSYELKEIENEYHKI